MSQTARTQLNISHATHADPESGAYEIIMIDEGEGNRYNFSAAVLETFTHQSPTNLTITSFLDHERRSVARDRPGRRSIRDRCGILSAIAYNPDTRALHARFVPAQPAGAIAAAVLDELVTHPDRADSGFSIDVSFAHDTDMNVTRISQIHSCDLVYDPARGGRVVRRLFHSLYPNPEQEEQPMSQTDTPITDNAPDNPPTQADAQPLARHRLELAERSSNLPETTSDGDVTPREQLATAHRAEAMLLQMSQNMLEIMLREAQLPPPAANRIRESFANRAADAHAIEQAIDTEREYLSEVTRHTAVQGLGAPNHEDGREQTIQLGRSTITIPPNSDPLDRLTAGVARWFGATGPAVENADRVDIIDAYVALTGDAETTGRFYPARTAFANVTDTTIAEVVADSMNVVIDEEWGNVENSDYFWWRQVAHVAPLDSFFDVHWTTYGGFQNLGKFTPGTEVTEIGVTDLSNAEDGTWEYPAGIVGVPLHTFDKAARRGWLQAMPRKMAMSAIRTLSADVSALFTANAGTGPVLTDGVNLFDAAHNNLLFLTMSTTSWATAVQTMYIQTEQESGARQGLRPWGVLVPIELEGTTIQVLANQAEHGTADRNINPYQYAAERVITVPEWTDANSWAAFTRPYPVGVGFRYGEQPRVVAEAGGMNSQGMFENRELRWKVEHFYNIGVINYRGLVKSNA